MTGSIFNPGLLHNVLGACTKKMVGPRWATMFVVEYWDVYGLYAYEFNTIYVSFICTVCDMVYDIPMGSVSSHYPKLT